MKDVNDDILKAVFSQMGDSYEYIKFLGKGATSRVYMVYQKHLKQHRALKIMDYEYVHLLMETENDTDSTVELNERRKRFINEANAYKKIKHPNVAEIYDIRQVEIQRGRVIIEIPYIIMEYVEGVPLSQLLKNQKPLKLETAAAISVDILDALKAIHQKDIIHRDIKPSNIMIEKGTDKATIIDFGLAKDILEGTHMTSAGLAMGTFLYMSPEQFADSSKVGPGTDIYSFGVILYEMLTGKPPYMGGAKELMHKHIYGEIPDIRKVDKDLPGIMDTLIRKAMAKKERNRGNVRYYKEILKDFSKKPGPESAETVISTVPVFKSRNIKRIAYTAVFIFIVMIALFLYFYLQQKPGKIANDRDEASTGGLKLPDPVYYSLHRDELRKCSTTQISTLFQPWVAACAREGTIIYRDASLTGDGFPAAFLQRFEVLDKADDKLKLKEWGKPNPGKGWTAMMNLIYLPRALRDEQTFAYQKVVFTEMEEQPEPGETGYITFYKSPGSDNRENIPEKRYLGNLRIAYVYAWENSDHEDSQWVLIGDSPTIKSVSKGENGFIKVVYGWCKTNRLFSWNSRMALVPNQEKNARAYIFKNDKDLINFYGKAGANSVPDTADLLTPDSYKMWKDSNWPFFLDREFYNPNQDYMRLFCLVDASQANVPGFSREGDEKGKERAYIKKIGYAVEKDPRFSEFNQFKKVYLFRKSELSKISGDLETILLEVLKPRKINILCKEMVGWIYVPEKYDPERTFNDYAQLNDAFTYKELSILFDKTQDQIDNMNPSQLDEIEVKIRKVRARLGDIINDQSGARFFGPADDPYIWLYEEELP
ncbi:MAG: serine/threonine-protein kinase [Candidatus Aminicenantes bacterium]